MTDSPAPTITKTKSLPLVWIVPLVAALVGIYIIYQEVSENGPTITITFADGSGLEAGKTMLRHKGMAVGVVEAVSLTKDFSKVKAVVALQKSAKGLAREGSKFWILRPEISLSGVQGLGTLISGPSIQVDPGKGDFSKHFEGINHTPSQATRPGTYYLLSVDTLGSLKRGSPVLYREVVVGEVTETYLADDASSVMVRIVVEPPYNRLVRSGSIFWNASGIAMKIGLLGAKIQTNSLESILAGGVMFATPEGEAADAQPAPQDTIFNLYPQSKEEWLKWKPSIPLVGK